MSEKEKSVMAKHKITSSIKTLYHYGQYTYERLDDAVRYAELHSGDLKQEVTKPPGRNVT